MQKILVVSDTHGHDNNFYDVLDIEEPVDGIIHCGDFEGSEGKFALAANCPVYFVAGNNDFFADLKREIEFDLGGHHAHRRRRRAERREQPRQQHDAQ